MEERERFFFTKFQENTFDETCIFMETVKCLVPWALLNPNRPAAIEYNKHTNPILLNAIVPVELV